MPLDAGGFPDAGTPLLQGPDGVTSTKDYPSPVGGLGTVSKVQPNFPPFSIDAAGRVSVNSPYSNTVPVYGYRFNSALIPGSAYGLGLSTNNDGLIFGGPAAIVNFGPSYFVLSGVTLFFNTAFGAATDLALSRAAAGALNISDSANGKALGIKLLTELLTIAAAATSTTTIQKPANSIILAVSVRVTVAVTCTSVFEVGDSTSANRFNTASVSKAATTTDKGTKAGAYYNATAEGIIITPDTVPSDATGRVRVTVHYLEIQPPTS